MLSSTRHSHSRSHRQERKPLMDSVLPGPMWLRSRSSERPARARDSYEIYSSSQLHQCRQEVYDFLLQHTTETREYLEELNYTEKRKKRHMVDYFTEQADMLLEKLKREMQSDEAIIEEDFIKKEPEEKLIAEWELFETHSPESKKPRNSQIEPYEIGELSPSHSINEERPSEKRHRERKEIKRGSNEKLSPEERRQMMGMPELKFDQYIKVFNSSHSHRQASDQRTA